jgi:hypothetical protein
MASLTPEHRYIYTDAYKGIEGGKGAGFSLSLVAESTTGATMDITIFFVRSMTILSLCRCFAVR